MGPNRSAHRAVGPSLHSPPTAPPRFSQTGRVLSVAGCLTTAGVLCVGFGAFISGNKVLAQNMMHARTSKTSWLSPRPAGAPEASSSARSCSRLPRALASLRQSAAWVSLAGYIGLVFSTQARAGGSSVRHHRRHGCGYEILPRQRRHCCCCGRSHKTEGGGTRPGGCVACVALQTWPGELMGARAGSVYRRYASVMYM